LKGLRDFSIKLEESTILLPIEKANGGQASVTWVTKVKLYDRKRGGSTNTGLNELYSIPEGREILKLLEWRRSWPLAMDFPMVNPAFKFSLISLLPLLGLQFVCWAKP